MEATTAVEQLAQSEFFVLLALYLVISNVVSTVTGKPLWPSLWALVHMAVTGVGTLVARMSRKKKKLVSAPCTGISRVVA